MIDERFLILFDQDIGASAPEEAAPPPPMKSEDGDGLFDGEDTEDDVGYEEAGPPEESEPNEEPSPEEEEASGTESQEEEGEAEYHSPTTYASDYVKYLNQDRQTHQRYQPQGYQQGYPPQQPPPPHAEQLKLPSEDEYLSDWDGSKAREHAYYEQKIQAEVAKVKQEFESYKQQARVDQEVKSTDRAINKLHQMVAKTPLFKSNKAFRDKANEYMMEAVSKAIESVYHYGNREGLQLILDRPEIIAKGCIETVNKQLGIKRNVKTKVTGAPRAAGATPAGGKTSLGLTKEQIADAKSDGVPLSEYKAALDAIARSEI